MSKHELAHVPLLEGEEKLKLFNLQHNFINKIGNLVSLPNLIYLDLSDNKINEISNIDTVPTLRVLMLGKNNISKLENLHELSKLDLLDLHSNKISVIENLEGLKELRVLNLAHNQISIVKNLNGLVSLSELNLRRNLIESIGDLSNCKMLQRLFLSNNQISEFENIKNLGTACQLNDLTMDGNKISSSTTPYYKFCIDTCKSLKRIDNKDIDAEFKKSIEAKYMKEQNNPTTPKTAANSDKKLSKEEITSPDVKPTVHTGNGNLITIISEDRN